MPVHEECLIVAVATAATQAAGPAAAGPTAAWPAAAGVRTPPAPPPAEVSSSMTTLVLGPGGEEAPTA